MQVLRGNFYKVASALPNFARLAREWLVALTAHAGRCSINREAVHTYPNTWRRLRRFVNHVIVFEAPFAILVRESVPVDIARVIEQDGLRLTFARPQGSPRLLHPQHERGRRPQTNSNFDGGQVEPFGDQINRRKDLDVATAEALDDVASYGAIRRAVDVVGSKACCPEGISSGSTRLDTDIEYHCAPTFSVAPIMFNAVSRNRWSICSFHDSGVLEVST